MPLIPESVLDEIQTRTDIAELVGRYVPLKRVGRHFKANCPFHKERTPSFMVNTDKQIFHCFGCGVGGNVFGFLMQHDRLTFPEAVRQLADHVGIRLPERDEASQETAQELYGLVENACRYYERMLADPAKGTPARAYFERRGVSPRSREAFRLGVAPEGWDRLLGAAKERGVSVERLEAAGLIVKGTSRPYDRFRHRLMFPIMDVRRRVVGFGGRSLDGTEPKYLNSPETSIYSKGRQLFGLAQAKDAIVEKKSVVIVEGYFDCVVLVDAGISNVVSPLGTALTADQARLLKRYAEEAILAFDPDAAGEQATLRGIDLLIEAGLGVRVARLPDGIDPDECLRAQGRERFQRLLEQSVTLFDFLVETALHRFSIKHSEGKVSAAQFVLPTIAKVPDAILRSEYVRRLAERLSLDETGVAQELAKARARGSAAAAAVAPSRSGSAPSAQGPERLLTALVLDDPSRWAVAVQRVALDEIQDSDLRTILHAIGELGAANRPMTAAHVASRLPEAQARLAAELVAFSQSVSAKDQAFDDCVRRIQAEARKREMSRLRERIRVAQDAGQEMEAQRWLAEYQRRLALDSSKSAHGSASHQAGLMTVAEGGGR